MTRTLHRAAIAAPVEVSDIRVLSRADLAVLAAPRPANSIQTLRDTHHRIARAVAAGLSNAEVAQVTGYSIGRINMLRQDPAFRDLVAHKRAMIDVEWAEGADPVVEYMRQNSLKAQAMLSDKLDHAIEQGEFLPTRDLLGIAEFGADRTGYGKVNKNVNVNVDFAANLEAARARSDTVHALRAIEAPSSGPQSVPGDGSQLPSSRRVPSPPLAATSFRRI